MTDTEHKELIILRKVAKKYAQVAILISDDHDKWGWKTLKLKDDLKTACKDAKIKSPLED